MKFLDISGDLGRIGERIVEIPHAAAIANRIYTKTGVLKVHYKRQLYLHPLGNNHGISRKCTALAVEIDVTHRFVTDGNLANVRQRRDTLYGDIHENLPAPPGMNIFIPNIDEEYEK